jgi:alcohol dehydrogenase, propanol-preferring
VKIKSGFFAMKAILLTSQKSISLNPLKLSDIEVPLPSENELLIKVHTCGICHTDLHIIEGELPLKKSPIVLGHQITGIVEKKGEAVSKFNIGNRVGVPWLFSTCGVCEYCKRGQENLCNKIQFTGYDVDGGYAEFMTVDENFAYFIPKDFSYEQAAPLMCAGIIGYRALKLSNIKPGEKLGLYGFGASAHISIQVARHLDCDVYVFSRSELHRKHAEELGAVWVGTSDEKPTENLDSIISFAPAGDIIPKALSVLRKGGTLALAGIYLSPIPPINYNLLYHERIIRSVANSTRQDAVDFLTLAGEISIKTEYEVFPMEETNRALQLVKASKINGAGVIKIR